MRMVRGLANMEQHGEKLMNREYLLLQPCQPVPLMSEKTQVKLQTLSERDSLSAKK